MYEQQKILTCQTFRTKNVPGVYCCVYFIFILFIVYIVIYYILYYTKCLNFKYYKSKIYMTKIISLYFLIFKTFGKT